MKRPNSPTPPLPERALYDRLVRSPRRRTLSIIINSNAEVDVRAPLRMGTAEIERLVESRRGWILQKQTELRREAMIRQQQSADLILYRGTEYPIIVREDAVAPVYLEENNGLIVAAGYRERREIMVASWLRFKAEEYLPQRVKELAGCHGIAIGKIKIADTRSQWGSCAANGNLSFCWRLIMAPDRVIDYVIFHELAHRRHLDHSPAFWRLVGQLCSDGASCRQWLRRHSRQLRQPQ